MASPEGRNASRDDLGGSEDPSILSPRGLHDFGRKVSTTASHLIRPLGDPTAHPHYQSAMTEVHKQLMRPSIQRSVFSLARTTPTEMVRSKLSAREIRSRALAYVPEEMLSNIPDNENTYSLFQGFQATHTASTDNSKRHRRRVSRGRRLIDEGAPTPDRLEGIQKLQKDKATMVHELEMLGIRKHMATSEIQEIDNKMANLAGMRKILVERFESLERDEELLENNIEDVGSRLEDARELTEEGANARAHTPSKSDDDTGPDDDDSDDDRESSGFMSKSIYEKLPPESGKKKKHAQRRSLPVVQEQFEPGSMIRQIRAHQDNITVLDFDAPFGTMVSSAMDDTVRVWDLSAGRCIGMLEGHTASVRTLQVEGNLLVTGSVDATIRLWDLSKAHYDPRGTQFGKADDDEDGIAFENPDDQPVDPPAGTMEGCPLYTLQAHMDEVTALHFRGDVLVSGSADKTLRHWDLEKGRCVQTLDIMWAATQASTNLGAAGPAGWRPTSRAANGSADFVGALQVFDAALACGTADGLVRLWDLRSGQVHRSLVGHTGPVTCLQFDHVHLVTGSLDRSVRIWDLRTGSIYDAFAYNNPITSMMFDTRQIVCAAGEDVVKVYDKVEGKHWDCGAGIAEAEESKSPAIVDCVRIRDGYMVEGRRDGIVGAWKC